MKFVVYLVEDPAAIDQEFFYLKRSDAFKHAKNVAAAGTPTKVVQYQMDLGIGKKLREMLVNLINRHNWDAQVEVLRVFTLGRKSTKTGLFTVRQSRGTQVAPPRDLVAGPTVWRIEENSVPPLKFLADSPLAPPVVPPKFISGNTFTVAQDVEVWDHYGEEFLVVPAGESLEYVRVRSDGNLRFLYNGTKVDVNEAIAKQWLGF